MNKKVIPIVVRLKQNNNEIIQGIAQNDAGVIFDITVMDGLVPFDFSGYSLVTLKIKKPDETFTYDSTGGTYVDIVDAEKGRLKLNIPTSCTAQNGMHFCRVSFSSDESTLFEAMMFNYFVGEDPNASDDEVIGTNEYPVLSNLIAQVSGMQSAETIRVNNEANREDAEAQRQAEYQTMMETLSTALAETQTALANANAMLSQVYEAIAEGGSIDVDTISNLATKSYVNNKVSNINCNTFNSQNQRVQWVRSRNVAYADALDLRAGELGYAYVNNELYIGDINDNKILINAPCFIASASEPDDTTKLWIDTSRSVPVIKYHDGTAWVPCNRAVFA